MRALKIQSQGHASVVEDAALPSLQEDYILVQVSHVALNPTDWKHIKYVEGVDNHTLGCDFAGRVVQIGSGVQKSWNVGDRIAGFTHGAKRGTPDSGAFAEYCVTKGDIACRIPDHMADAQAATLGVGIVTVGQALYQSLQLPWPENPDHSNTPVLIYGGSSATGLFALQFAKASGLRVMTTCSPRYFDKCKAFGADECFDYNSRDQCGAAIRQATDNGLLYALDCICSEDAAAICANALTSEKGKARYSSLLGNELPRPEDDVRHNVTAAYTVNGEPFHYFGQDEPAEPQDFEFGKKWWTLVEKFIADGKLKTFETVKEGGLQGILDGLKDLEEGKVSGEKLVYKVQDL